MQGLELAKNYKGESGIYKITLLTDGRCYIGSTIDLNRRLSTHYNLLSKSKHENSYLQRVFDKYKETSFSVEVIEMCKVEDLLTREQYWIDYYNSNNRDVGFNLSPVAGSNLGLKKTKEQIENFQKAIQGKHNTLLSVEDASKIKEMINEGMSLTRIAEIVNVDYEYIRSIKRGSSFKYVDPQINYDINMSAKLTEEQVVIIKKKLNEGVKVKELSVQYGVSHRTISAIKNEITWKGVGDKIIAPKRKSRLNDNK